MTLKRTIKLLKEYLRMNNFNVIELTDKAELSSSERTANKYRLDEINKIREFTERLIKNLLILLLKQIFMKILKKILKN